MAEKIRTSLPAKKRDKTLREAFNNYKAWISLRLIGRTYQKIQGALARAQ